MALPANIPWADACPPIFLLGPTGSGKSAVALALARLLGRAEIVSADAYQTYRGMPILTAAPSPEELHQVPHHLIGDWELTRNNDAACHARRAEACIQAIQKRGCVPIVTGGSGLYVKFISHGISPAPPSDPALRAQLAALPLEEAVHRLREADPEGAAATNLQNPRYVIRNLEIVLLSGRPLSCWRSNWQHPPLGPGFSLVWETPQLDARIARRAEEMVRQGVLEEVAALEDCPLAETARKTLGLEQVRACLHGELSRPELVTALAQITRQYAKRQRTWLRREPWLVPLPVQAGESSESLAERVLAKLVSPSLDEKVAQK